MKKESNCINLILAWVYIISIFLCLNQTSKKVALLWDDECVIGCSVACRHHQKAALFSHQWCRKMRTTCLNGSYWRVSERKPGWLMRKSSQNEHKTSPLLIHQQWVCFIVVFFFAFICLIILYVPEKMKQILHNVGTKTIYLYSRK